MSEIRIKFSPHAEFKLRLYKFNKEEVKVALLRPDKLMEARFGRWMAVRLLDDYALIVIYEKVNGTLRVITLYPTSRRRIEKWLK